MLELWDLLDSFHRARVLVVGDVMVDRFIYGSVERISPEAPVPVIHIEREERTLGGAGNVLRNLHALGVNTCFVSVTGTDPAGREVARMVAGLGSGAGLGVAPGAGKGNACGVFGSGAGLGVAPGAGKGNACGGFGSGAGLGPSQK